MALFSRRAMPTVRTPAHVTPIGEAERDWLDAHVALVADAGFDVDDADALRRCYEQWAGAWRRVNPPERDDPAVMVNALGAAFGEFLTHRTALAWGLVEDEGGLDLALFRGRSDVLMRPVSFVASRWSAEEPSGAFLAATSSQLVAALSGPRRGRRARSGEASARR
ncbi:DUF3806 domain-containing protein [Agromyces aurantiacus]|uniref:DUF3806 domain-containing protein n=1 Tax=Agromyces aurantiacus TaxID=165814 RepID=A0ABV9R6P6_9MICO|nr:DUF3806 domain-containing protein [Agromyces aurantiacus]MBM7503816.1 hypothetical protein [Agromyces aurantiacus]